MLKSSNQRKGKGGDQKGVGSFYWDNKYNLWVQQAKIKKFEETAYNRARRHPKRGKVCIIQWV